jgi:hypothetical protein
LLSAAEDAAGSDGPKANRLHNPRQASASPITPFPARQRQNALPWPCKRKLRSMWETSILHSARALRPVWCGLDSSDPHDDVWTLGSRHSGLGKTLDDLKPSLSYRGIGCPSLLMESSLSCPCPSRLVTSSGCLKPGKRFSTSSSSSSSSSSLLPLVSPSSLCIPSNAWRRAVSQFQLASLHSECLRLAIHVFLPFHMHQ